MTTIDLQDTLEKLREEKYPNLDSRLVSQIVTSQAAFMENPNEAYKLIKQCVEAYLVVKVDNNDA